MDDYLESFYLWLQDSEFEPNESKNNWVGAVSVDWENPENGEPESAKHVVNIWLPEGFPYHAPVVYSKDEPPLAPGWHLNPGSPSSLCLWDSETGWRPEYTAHKLLNRICDWFYYYHTDSWPTNSQVPDLHLYLNNVGTVIIGEDWNPPAGILNGQFTLWRSRKFTGIIDIAGCGGEQHEPEPRIADNVIFGSNPTRLKGAWFRVPQPFVPSGSLSILLSQVDRLLQKPAGWSVTKGVEAIGMKTAGEGFPIAIGYPDRFGEERWLFLWSRYPERKRKRYKWSSDQNLHQIEMMSFRTAPASKEALLRRSAYISTSLTSKRIALFGVGSLGSSMALLLAKAGVGELRLVDSDYLAPGNVMRHICDLSYVGFKKTMAVKRKIARHNLDCYIECYEKTWVKNKLRDISKECDLVIDATGNINFSRYLNKVCVEFNQPVVFAVAYRRAKVGRVISRADSRDPCLECYLGYREEWSNDVFPTIPADPNESFIEDGCGSVTEEAVALDVEAAANFGIRQAIRSLQGAHSGSNLGIIVNDPLPDSGNGILCSPAQHYWTNRPYRNCSVCRK